MAVCVRRALSDDLINIYIVYVLDGDIFSVTAKAGKHFHTVTHFFLTRKQGRRWGAFEYAQLGEERHTRLPQAASP
jgi:hypothetical protein